MTKPRPKSAGLKGVWHEWKSELTPGLTTFLTMSYIVVVNPTILSTEGTGLSFSGVLTATVLLCFSMTLLMGLYAKLPFAVAPGMGINAFFAFNLILGRGIAWPTALGMVFWAGVLFVLASVTPVRVMLAKAIPMQLRIASAVGIGVFISFIGLKNAGWIEADPVTLVKLGRLDSELLLCVLGVGIGGVLLARKSPWAYLASILLVTGLAAAVGDVSLPSSLVSTPDFDSTFFRLDLWGALAPALFPAIMALFFTDLFDSISTFIGVSHATGLTTKGGEPERLKEGLFVDAFATLGAGLFGTSSGTAYIESASGIQAGGRTGRTAVVTALCFLPCLFIGPVVAMVPAAATSPVLILVGASMFSAVRGLIFEKVEDALPAFLTVVLIPLTFSITQGMLWGFVAYVVLYAVVGRIREVHPMMIGVGFLSVILLLLESQV
jgi:AGZA family xanthine/uracil permease-like MFS transporter